MRHCKSCKVDVAGNIKTCPLCKNELDSGNDSDSVFPVIPSIYEEQNIVFKILIFVSILAVSICSVINYSIDNFLSWSWFVITGIAFFWLNLISAIYKRNNPNAIIFNQILLFSACFVIYDYLNGFTLWSITYALPFLCIIAMPEMFILSLILKYEIHDYIIYLFFTSVLGILQIMFVVLGLVSVTLPSIICCILSIVMISTILVFGNRKCRKELRRKFHI